MTLAQFYHWVFAGVWAVHYCFVMLVVGIPILGLAERLVKGRDGGKAWAFLRDPYPICISLTITTGVAPLLFGQVLFHRVFYQALIVMYPLPLIGLVMLIAFFYVSYLVKHVEKLALPLAFVQVAFVLCFMLFFGMLFSAITKGSGGLRELWGMGKWPPLLWHSLGAHVVVSVIMSRLVLTFDRQSWWLRGGLLLVIAAGVSAAREVLRAHFGGDHVIPLPITDHVDISAGIFLLCFVVMAGVLYHTVRVAFGCCQSGESPPQL